MIKVMLDTNICIYIIKRKPQKVLDHLLKYTPGEVAVSSITAAELQYGVEKSSMPDKNRLALSKFLHAFVIVPFDEKATQEYGKIRASLESKGTPIGPNDMLIAASAQSLGCVLVTNNLKEFARVPTLRIENWVD